MDSRLDEDAWFMLSFFLLSLIVALVCSSPPLFLSNQSLSMYINTNGNSFYLLPINERDVKEDNTNKVALQNRNRNRDRDRESV
jgi:hypothetical protein